MARLVDFFLQLPVIDELIYHFWELMVSGFALLVTLIGLANRKLPSRDDIKIEHFHNQTIGDNSKLWQLLAKFHQANTPAPK